MDAKIPVILHLADETAKALGIMSPSEVNALIRMHQARGIAFKGEQWLFDHYDLNLIEDNGPLVADIYFVTYRS